MKSSQQTPNSVEELMARAHQLTGFTLGELAQALGWPVPDDLRSAKGWTGQLIEACLGASAGSKPEQDFPELGVELKTIPITAEGKPLETTYVCIAPLTGLNGVTWETSNVRNKLQRVLWMTVDGRREQPLSERLVGVPILWTPTPEQESILRADWEEITEAIVLGRVDQITGRHGIALQLRPKAANSRVETLGIGPDGAPIRTLPRGYYLKTSFTQAVLQEAVGAKIE
ncbi:DNA mismatch repair endonuclease MutH [Aliidiomarina indica]|uniref:DNA mismatch repair endonuclease MutH n=1 Tax=Aliidiomarina indica TaxID=2749147 RepID=UPI0022B178D3|nr:DNA mismatch repair endonuclease MutH [Aliidiomarina indica]